MLPLHIVWIPESPTCASLSRDELDMWRWSAEQLCPVIYAPRGRVSDSASNREKRVDTPPAVVPENDDDENNCLLVDDEVAPETLSNDFEDFAQADHE